VKLALCAVLGLTLLAGCAGDDPEATTAPSPIETGSTPTAPETVPAPATGTTAPPETVPETGTAEPEAGAPAEPPPEVAGDPDPPPPAWIESSAGPIWLDYGSYCWDDACARMGLGSCDDGTTPIVQVSTGETVRFHVGADPARATLSVDRSRPERLLPGETMEWNANRAGVLVLRIRADAGTASYAACLEILGV
jgi:hypothetical protein